MTERKPGTESFESWIDKQIREATERGEFDDLPGEGKPLPGSGRPLEEQWWLKDFLRREELSTEPLLPTPMKLRREVERLPERVRSLSDEQQVRDAVRELNQRIVQWYRSGSGPQLLVRPVNPEQVVEQWRADRSTAPAPAPSAAQPAAPTTVGAPAATRPATAPRDRGWRAKAARLARRLVRPRRG